MSIKDYRQTAACWILERRKFWKQREQAKNYKVRAARGERRTVWDQSYSVIWCVCVCACVLSVWILVLSGSLRVYRGKGVLGQRSSMMKARRTKICCPLLSAPPTYLSIKGMIPGAFLLNCDDNQSALSWTINCNKTAWKHVKGSRDLWIAIFEWYRRMAGHAGKK